MNTKCPKCGGEINDLGGFIKCENNVKGDLSSCNFNIWRDQLKTLGKPQISDPEFGQLIGYQEIPLELISPKSKKSFKCNGRLVEERGHWVIQFVFPDSPVKIFGKSETVAIPIDSDSEDNPEY